MTGSIEKLISAYLDLLFRELRGLPPRQRREIMEEVSADINESISRYSSSSEAEARNVLDRLGDPSEIAGEAYRRFGIQGAGVGVIEVAALILLPVGGIILPVIGWIVGVILLWISKAWTNREKLIGTLIIPGGLLVPFLVSFLASTLTTCSTLSDGAGRVIEDTCAHRLSEGPHPLFVIGFIVLVVAPLVSITFLIWKLRQRSKVLVQM